MDLKLILIPRLVGQTCLLLDDTLIPPHLENCTLMTGRSYAAFNRPINGISGGILTGANALDVARIGMDNALLTNNLTMLVDAYQRVHLELVIQDTVFSDGIRSDGAFGMSDLSAHPDFALMLPSTAQHAGMLYNGNYGGVNFALTFRQSDHHMFHRQRLASGYFSQNIRKLKNIKCQCHTLHRDRSRRDGAFRQCYLSICARHAV